LPLSSTSRAKFRANCSTLTTGAPSAAGVLAAGFAAAATTSAAWANALADRVSGGALFAALCGALPLTGFLDRGFLLATLLPAVCADFSFIGCLVVREGSTVWTYYPVTPPPSKVLAGAANRL